MNGFIKRSAGEVLARFCIGFPVIGNTGPRQAGKTTLARQLFSDKPYVTLEDPDQLDFSRTDPRRFLAQFPDGAIFDEVQRCPEIFSYIQGVVDEHQVIAELAKQYYAKGDIPSFYFWRDQSGLEIDLVIEDAGRLVSVEIKSGQTLVADFFKGLKRWTTLAGDEAREPALIYGGDENQQRSGVRVYGWQSVGALAGVTE